MELTQARTIAEDIVERLQPHCRRVEIAGSIRRGKAEVHDIEIVAVPFEFAELTLPHIFAGARLIKNGPRYMKIQLREGIDLDLFLVRPPAQWGVIFVIRTGPAEFSRLAVTRRCFGGLLPSNCKVENGQVWRFGKSIPMPEAGDFLALLGLREITPEERQEKYGKD